MTTAIIVEELRKIEDRNGRLTADAVVKAARPPKHPLHDRFTWNDSVAADQWRLEEARRLIRYVYVETEEHERVISSVAYVRDPSADSDEQGYRAIRKLRDDRDDAREAVLAEFTRAAAALRRARDIAASLGFGDEIEQLATQVTRLSAKIETEASMSA